MGSCCGCFRPGWDDAVCFSLDGKEVDAKVMSVYDGDTVILAFSIHHVMYRWKCRISGIDTPEVRTKNHDEKAMGYRARDALRDKILGRVVRVTCGKFDKYGRILVDIHVDGVSIGDWLVSNGYAQPYDGGTKRPWGV